MSDHKNYRIAIAHSLSLSGWLDDLPSRRRWRRRMLSFILIQRMMLKLHLKFKSVCLIDCAVHSSARTQWLHALTIHIFHRRNRRISAQSKHQKCECVEAFLYIKAKKSRFMTSTQHNIIYINKYIVVIAHQRKTKNFTFLFLSVVLFGFTSRISLNRIDLRQWWNQPWTYLHRRRHTHLHVQIVFHVGLASVNIRY